MNRLTVNSMRFMMEAAEIDSDGASGAFKLQGLALAWARVFAVWIDDTPPDFVQDHGGARPRTDARRAHRRRGRSAGAVRSAAQGDRTRGDEARSRAGQLTRRRPREDEEA